MVFELTKPDISAWRSGNTGVEGVWHFDSAKPGRHVLITALVHGNELCGAWALKALLEANVRPAQGSMTLAFCNLAAFDRFDPADHDASRFVDEDMNRVWSASKLTAPSTLEARRASALLPWIGQTDWLLDIHSMHEPCMPLLLTGLQPRNLALARLIGAPQHIVVDAGHQDGVRLRDFGRFGQANAQDACALLIECGFHGAPASKDVALDMAARFLIASEVMQIGHGSGQLLENWLMPQTTPQRAVRVTEALVAQSNQLSFTQDWQGLQIVPSAGTPIATDGAKVFVTPYDQCTLVMPSLRQLRTGVTVVRFAQQLANDL
jgi:Succinylglutamate desuccinylase / Aspartoacylase family